MRVPKRKLGRQRGECQSGNDILKSQTLIVGLEDRRWAIVHGKPAEAEKGENGFSSRALTIEHSLAGILILNQ
jgi:hypothetical protein